jgi:hypothetical protein
MFNSLLTQFHDAAPLPQINIDDAKSFIELLGSGEQYFQTFSDGDDLYQPYLVAYRLVCFFSHSIDRNRGFLLIVTFADFFILFSSEQLVNLCHCPIYLCHCCMKRYLLYGKGKKIGVMRF